MMTQLDEASDKIPEGLYLKFCDHLKNLHTCQPTQVFLQRPSAPRRCGRCYQVGHNRRSCEYYEADHRALFYAYQNGQTPSEAGIERKAVVRSNWCEWSPDNGGNIVITIYMPEVEDIVDIPAGYATFQGRRELHIKIPGKYRAEISLPAKTDEVVSHTWNPRTHILTVTLQMAPRQKPGAKATQTTTIVKIKPKSAQNLVFSNQQTTNNKQQ